MFELAHVAFPFVFEEKAPEFLRDTLYVLAVNIIEIIYIVVNEVLNIIFSFP